MPLNTSTRYLLTITALVVVVVLANWLWTLTTFWSAIYVGEHKLQTLFYYHLYRSPMLLAVGLIFWAFYKKNPWWLVGNIFLADPATFFTFGAIWLLSSQLTQPELIETVPLMNEWLVFIFFSLSMITFITHWISSRNTMNKLSKCMKMLAIYLIALSITRLIIIYFNFIAFGPLAYLATNQLPLYEQFLFIIKGLPNILLALLTIWIIITQKFYYFFVHILVAIYDFFLANPTIIQGMKYNWGETDILSVAGTASSITTLILYTTAYLVFIVWLYHWKSTNHHPH